MYLLKLSFWRRNNTQREHARQLEDKQRRIQSDHAAKKMLGYAETVQVFELSQWGQCGTETWTEAMSG